MRSMRRSVSIGSAEASAPRHSHRRMSHPWATAKKSRTLLIWLMIVQCDSDATVRIRYVPLSQGRSGIGADAVEASMTHRARGTSQ